VKRLQAPNTRVWPQLLYPVRREFTRHHARSRCVCGDRACLSLGTRRFLGRPAVIATVSSSTSGIGSRSACLRATGKTGFGWPGRLEGIAGFRLLAGCHTESVYRR